MSENSDVLIKEEKASSEALNEPGDEEKEGGEVIKSPVFVVSVVSEKSPTPNKYHIKDCGAASHDIIIQAREDYQLNQSFGI